MTQMSYRVPKGTPQSETDQRNMRLRIAYETYAATTPFPGSRHTPPLIIEAFESEAPYTEHGKVRGVVWSSSEQGLDRWWQGAIRAVMCALREEFPHRGVSIITDKEGSALKLKPVSKATAS